MFVGCSNRMLAARAFTLVHTHACHLPVPLPFPTMASKAAQKRVRIFSIAPLSLLNRPHLALQGVYQHAERATAVCLGCS